MNKTLKIYGILLIVVMLLLSLFQLNKSAVIDWRKTFDLDGKEPFGLLVFNKEADSLFQNKIQRVYESPYAYFSRDSVAPPQNILLIEREITQPAWKKIIERVQKGDNVLLLKEKMPRILEDSLHFRFSRGYYRDSLTLFFTDKKLKKSKLYLNKMQGRRYFWEKDSIPFETLSVKEDENGYKKRKEVCFVKIKYGKGTFYLHSEPVILTNYYLLNAKNTSYIQHLFSYLPTQKTLWFLEEKDRLAQSRSPLRFILQNPPLRYAWYLFFVALLLFVFFYAKRKQRIVPIIEPLKNSSVAFVKSISNLYLQEGNYKDIAHKKATYFLHKIRTDLWIDTRELDADFIQKLQIKTGKDKKTVEKAVRLLKMALHPYEEITEKKLTELNRTLNKIYK